MPSSDPPGYHLCGLEQEDGRYGSQVSKALKPTLQCPLSALKTLVTEFCRGIDLGDTNLYHTLIALVVLGILRAEWQNFIIASCRVWFCGLYSLTSKDCMAGCWDTEDRTLYIEHFFLPFFLSFVLSLLSFPFFPSCVPGTGLSVRIGKQARQFLSFDRLLHSNGGDRQRRNRKEV